jgi:hypothetical protein
MLRMMGMTIVKMGLKFCMVDGVQQEILIVEVI